MIKNRIWIMAGMLALLLTTGCGAPVMKPFASPDLRGRGGGVVAMMPFDNLSNDQSAGKTMENLVLVEFLRSTPTRILDPGEVGAALLDERIRVATSIPKATVLALGERLKADFLMQGVVHEYAMQRMTTSGGSGEVPVVSVSLRLVDTRTGEIAWAMSSSRRGNDHESLFGIGRVESLEQLAQDIVESMAGAYTGSI